VLCGEIWIRGHERDGSRRAYSATVKMHLRMLPVTCCLRPVGCTLQVYSMALHLFCILQCSCHDHVYATVHGAMTIPWVKQVTTCVTVLLLTSPLQRCH
jgi:hypothetical protein